MHLAFICDFVILYIYTVLQEIFFFPIPPQHPAGWASAQGCSDCSPANGGANGVTCDACDVGGPPKPLLKASACNDSIKRLAAWRSASRSSAVCRLQNKEKHLHVIFTFIEKFSSFVYYCSC